MSSRPAGPSSILVRLPNWVGDIVMALPALGAITTSFPGARLVAMARPAHVALVSRIRGIHEVIEAPRARGLGRLAATWAAARRVRAARCDLAVLLATSFEAALAVWSAGVPVRLGHPTDHRAALLTAAVPLRDGHRADAFLDVAVAAGAEARGCGGGELDLTAGDGERAARWIAALGSARQGAPIFVNPAAAKTPRAWSGNRFRLLALQLAERFPDAPVLVHDRAPFRAPDGWPPETSVHLVSGVSLVELAAILKRCRAYVGNDSGPMHLAAALGVPTIGIYGPSSPDRTAPRGASHVPVTARFGCSPCRERFFVECPSAPSDDGRPPCLEAVAVEEVVSAVGDLLVPWNRDALDERPSR